MNAMIRTLTRAARAAALLALPAVSAVGDEGDVSPHLIVGVIDAESRLGFGFEGIEPDPAITIDTFDAFAGGFINIQFSADQDFAFAAADAEEAAEFGLVPLAPGSAVALEAVELDDDFSVFLFGQDRLDAVGERLTLGGPGLDVHPLYIFERPTFDPDFAGSVTGRFRLVDTSGGLGASDPFSLTFRVVPEPASLALLGLGALAIGTRRRA